MFAVHLVFTMSLVQNGSFRLLMNIQECVGFIFFLKKTKVARIFQNFHAMVKNQLQTTIKVLRVDNGIEYFKTFQGDFLATNGILYQSFNTDTPQQNGVEKRKNRNLLDVAKALMFIMSVPKYFWGEAVLTACHLINRMPSKVLNFKTPLSVLLPTYPLFRCPTSVPLKTFGCIIFVHDHWKYCLKLDLKSIKCVFVGIYLHSEGISVINSLFIECLS